MIVFKNSVTARFPFLVASHFDHDNATGQSEHFAQFLLINGVDQLKLSFLINLECVHVTEVNNIEVTRSKMLSITWFDAYANLYCFFL